MSAVGLITKSSDVVVVITKLIDIVGPLAKQALENVDIEDVEAAARKAADTVANTAKDAADKTKNAFSDAASAVGDVANKVVSAKDKALDDATRKKAEKQLRKAVKDIRQSILENATTSITVADLLKAKEKTGSFGPISTMPGCFVIATYKKLDFDKDLTDYTGLYVGKADNASEGVALAISRDGDPDVYADVKYNQNVHVYVYNCLPEDLEEQYHDLRQTFSDVVIPEASDA